MSALGNAPDFDMHRLILEVKARPAIWDANAPEYSDKNAKGEAWHEIYKVFAPTYDTDEPFRQYEVSRTVQRKWKSLRDSFVREINLQATDTRTLRRKYRYYKELYFLRSNITKRKGIFKFNDDSETTMNENNTFEDVDLQVPWSTKAQKTETNEDLQNFLEENQTESHEFNPSENMDIAHKGKSTLSMRRNSGKLRKRKFKDSARETDLLNEVVTALKENKSSSSTQAVAPLDGDKYFLLSLLDELKKVPEEYKLDAKADILLVLKKWQKLSQINTQQYETCFEQQQNQSAQNQQFLGPQTST